MKTERLKMTVEFDVTESQALALQAMLEYWNQLASIGSSRQVAYYVDGDGNFKPKCKFIFDRDITPLTPEMRKLAIIEDNGGDRVYDFDPISWFLSKSNPKGPNYVPREPLTIEKIAKNPQKALDDLEDQLSIPLGTLIAEMEEMSKQAQPEQTIEEYTSDHV